MTYLFLVLKEFLHHIDKILHKLILQNIPFIVFGIRSTYVYIYRLNKLLGLIGNDGNENMLKVALLMVWYSEFYNTHNTTVMSTI